MFVEFVDSTPYNRPLPQGILVFITQGADTIDLVGAGFLQPGGILNVNLTPGQTYTATFFGSAAPTVPVTFVCPSGNVYLETETGQLIVTEFGQPIIVIPGFVIVPNYTTPNSIYFFDETGINPLPAGLPVSVYRAPNPPTNPGWSFVGKGYTGLGGIVTGIPLIPGQQYGAEFIGVQAPAMCSAHFQANPNAALPTIATADDYRSPALSQQGYTNEQMNLWPRGWFSNAATSPGGNAYALAWGIAMLLAVLDLYTQYLLSIMRLFTSTGADIDSWAQDIFGFVFVRCASWSDATWIANILTIFGAQKTTIAGMQTILNMYVPCYMALSAQQMGLDYQGSLDYWGNLDYLPDVVPTSGTAIGMGLDTFGAMDTTQTFMDVPQSGNIYQLPNIIIFDSQSNPVLWALLFPATNANLALGLDTLGGLDTTQTFMDAPNLEPLFCVYFQYTAFADTYIHQIVPTVPQLTALVNACKALGTVPIYASNIPS